MHAFLTSAYVAFGPDEFLFRAMNLAGTSRIVDLAMVLITSLGVDYILVPLAIPLWFTGRREAAFDYLLVFGITVLFTLALKYGVGRPRPCEVLPDVHLITGHECEARDPAFPSGHASRAFAVAGFAVLRFRRRIGVPAFVFATLVGFSRIYMGLHWPTDVLGGALLAIAVALFIERLHRRAPRYQRIRARIVETIPRWRRKPRPA